jgi:L-rhamnose-H+ transport protein
MAPTFIGVLFHALGGIFASSFYLPLRKVKLWAWESYWLVGGVVSWLIVPVAVVYIVVPDVLEVYAKVSSKSLFWTYAFGVLWGVGGLTFGLTMRFLGISLGYAIALGLTAMIGTIVPPLYSGQMVELIQNNYGQVTLLGVLLIGVGVAVCGGAGFFKDKELTSKETKSGDMSEYNLVKGIVAACVAGVMSACMAFALAAGKPIAEASVYYGTESLWQNSGVFLVIFLGGLTTNSLWCLYLNWKNSTFTDYSPRQRGAFKNYALCILSGSLWYGQFLFYGFGATYMGEFEFAGWSLHMGFIILFSTLWGLLAREWNGASSRTQLINYSGLCVLVVAIGVIGFGGYLKLT